MNNLGHFLNSRAWAEFRQALGEQTRHREADQWSYLGLIQTTGGFKKFYCPYSPVVYQAEGLAELMADIDTEAKKAHAMVTQIEPLGAITADDLANYGYTKIKSIQPELTWVLDLTQEREQILAGMASSNRNIYRNYHKKGLEFAQTESMDDVDTVLRLIEAVAKHNQAHLHQASYLRRQAEVLMASGAMRCFVVRLEGQVIAGALVYDDQTTRYYAHAAADYEHRKLKAGVVLLSEMILEAKERGLEWFDFYGITDSADPNHPWAGFTAFKKGFGGQEKRYLGTWQKVNRPLLYRLYCLLRGLRSATRK